jgi:chromosome segregation ATPase
MNGRWCNLQLEGLPRFVYFALVLCLGGCATSDDPREGGFVSGVVGLASGGYEKRVDDRERRYGAERGEQRRLMAEAEALERERMKVKRELQQADRRLAAVESKMRRARARSAGQRRPSGSSEQVLRRLDATEAKISSVKGALDETRGGDRPVADLKARSIEINKELDEIDSLVDMVAGSSF